MTKLVGLFGLLVLLVVPAVAQDNPATTPVNKPAKEKLTYSTPKVELSGEFSYRRFYDVDGATLGMKGWNFSANYNIFRWLGGEVQVSNARQNQYFLGNTSVSNILFGPKFYPFGHRKVTPFGEFVIGAGLYRNSIPAFGGFSANEPTYAAIMWQGGGGIDYNRWKHLGIRLIEADFGHANFFPNYQFNRLTSSFSVGVVYRFGEK
jgi:hypothetical protein